jgi:hypothetical protein
MRRWISATGPIPAEGLFYGTHLRYAVAHISPL